jgi:flagellar biosynthesis/type III secretory pathway protein FliH
MRKSNKQRELEMAKSASYEMGKMDGYQEGLSEGRKQIDAANITKLEACVKLMNSAGQFQEALTRLIMATNGEQL